MNGPRDNGPRDISDLKASLRRKPAQAINRPPGVVEGPAQVSTDGGQTWAAAPEPPATGTNGPRPVQAPPKVPPRAPALLEAAAALARLALTELGGKAPSADEVGAACAQLHLLLIGDMLGDNPSPVEVGVVCARLLGAIRPAEGRIEATASAEGDLSVEVRGMEVPAGGRPWKGVYPPAEPVSARLPADPRRGWHVIETSTFERGEVRVVLRLPIRAATPEEIAEELATEGK